MDEAMGWQGGTADNWTKQQGYESLGATSQGGGTGGALASWATDPTNMTADQYKTMAGPMQGATTYTPSDNALVSNNLTKLLASDNPYMTLARSKAQAYSNSRGLLNSTMAGQAGERAAIESALPLLMLLSLLLQPAATTTAAAAAIPAAIPAAAAFIACE